MKGPQKPLSELDILSASEREQLLVEWNDTAVEYAKDKSIQTLFEEQVDKAPDAMAVICGEERLTYGELNARANQLAHYLKGMGVGPEVCVGICVERSLEVVVGFLGILKAGGCMCRWIPAIRWSVWRICCRMREYWCY